MSCSFGLVAQEFNCKVAVNADQISKTNKQLFTTLENSLNEFVNQKKWTNKQFKEEERINCNFTFVFTAETAPNSYTGSLQVSATRPIFNSSYNSPVFNFKDAKIDINYIEYSPLVYNPTVFESELISLVTYYLYMVLGVDASTFELNGGKPYFEQAMDIALQAQQGGSEGWTADRNSLNRFALVDQVLSSSHEEYLQVMYNYHRLGFDTFTEDKEESKEVIFDSLLLLQELFNRERRPYLIRFFMDAKADEIVSIFSGGPDTVNLDELKSTLLRISAPNREKWDDIEID